MERKKATTATERVRAYRARLRRKGMKKIEIWVPDTSSPDFLAEARRQSRLSAIADRTDDTVAAFQSIAVWPEP